MADESQGIKNVVHAEYPFGSSQQIVYEEARLKSELGQQKSITYNQDVLHQVQFYPNRFDQKLLARLRLAFLTSQTIRDVGGTQAIRDTDFSTDFDEFNRECSLQFLIDSIDKDLSHKLKPREVYQQKIAELEERGIDSLAKFGMLNVHRLHLDEREVLERTLKYLIRERKN